MKKNVNVFNLLLTAAIFMLVSGCRKGFIENQADPQLSTGKQGRTLTTLDVAPDVYVAGSDGGQAKYWKNGQSVILPGGTQATGIAVVGTDVYVCGWSLAAPTYMFVAQYWKNGILTNLSNGTSDVLATGIAVSGTDVYIAGTEGRYTHTGLYWKNGAVTSLGSGQPNGVFVSTNGDVYIPNVAWPGGATYWKNGTLLTLPGTNYSMVNAIAVQGSNVYAVGVNDNGSSQTALYWLNGVSQTMTQHYYSNARAVAVSATGQAAISGTVGQDYNNRQIAYWNTFGDPSILSSGQFLSTTTGVAVDGMTGDVYVCGSENDPSTPSTRAKYWKISSTGSVDPVSLPNGSTALAITLGQ